jgi:hypothetical protein
MARPEVTRGTIALGATGDVDAFGIEEFCRRHRISVQLFYKNRKQMPRTFNVGRRVLISRKAAEEWRRAQENATAACNDR